MTTTTMTMTDDYDDYDYDNYDYENYVIDVL